MSVRFLHPVGFLAPGRRNREKDGRCSKEERACKWPQSSAGDILYAEGIGRVIVPDHLSPIDGQYVHRTFRLVVSATGLAHAVLQFYNGSPIRRSE